MRILVTGATAGIGLSTATILAGMGHTVLVHGRSAEKAQRAADAVRAVHPDARCPQEACDLSSLEAVRAWAGRLREQPLDVIIHNAGVFTDRPTQTADGFELTWAVNHLAPFLLTSLLLDRLLDRPHSRVISVSSMGHRSGRIRLDDPNMTRGFNGIQAYCQSKLANVLFTQELARRTRGSSLVAHALHPGVVMTKMLRRTGFTNQPTDPPDVAAATSVFLATDPGVAATSGGYFVRCRPAAPGTTDPVLGRRLWALSEQQCGLV